MLTATWYYGFCYQQSYQRLSSTSKEIRDTPSHRMRSWESGEGWSHPAGAGRNEWRLLLLTVKNSLAADFSFHGAVHRDCHHHQRRYCPGPIRPQLAIVGTLHVVIIANGFLLVHETLLNLKMMCRQLMLLLLIFFL